MATTDYRRDYVHHHSIHCVCLRVQLRGPLLCQ